MICPIPKLVLRTALKNVCVVTGAVVTIAISQKIKGLVDTIDNIF